MTDEGRRSSPTDAADTDTDGGQWRFAIDEVGEDAEPARLPIEPESPSLENALFVAVGVVATVLLLWISI